MPETTLAALLAERFTDDPAAPALSQGEITLTYAELDARTGALAAALKAQGVGAEVFVAIALPRSIDAIVAILATIRAGGAYVPLNPDDPTARLEDILDECGAAVLLAEHPIGSTPVLSPKDWPREGAAPDPQEVSASDLAYAIYTSGSTGRPKGVLIEHAAIVNSGLWVVDDLGFKASDKILHKAPITFDLSVWEIFVPFLCGGELVIAPDGVQRDPREILHLIRHHGITTVMFVPTMLNLFLDVLEGEPPLKLDRIIAGGEALQISQRARVHELLDTKLYHAYGPTEAAVFVTLWNASKEDNSDPMPSGYPGWNTQVYVLDNDLKMVPPGTMGRLWLAGHQLARGYLKRDDLTAERFVDNPFIPGARMYDSGDLAEWREDGALICHGRVDTQVKLNGIRLELGEVEAAVETLPGITQAAAVLRDDLAQNETRLVVFYTGTAQEEPKLRKAMVDLLPAHAMPSRIIPVEAFPYTSSGKVDRKILIQRKIESTRPATATKASRPSSDTAHVITTALAELLSVEAAAIDRSANFFDLGATSLQLVYLRERLRESLNHTFPVSDFFLYTSINKLAAHLDGVDEDAPAVAPATPSETTSDLIAIVGMAGRFPGAASVDDLWQSMVDGRELISHFSEDELDFDPRPTNPGIDYILSRGTMIDPDMFDAKHFGIPPREAEQLDPQHRVLLEVAQTALEDAGHDPDRFAGKIGIFCGASQSSYLLNNLVSAPGASRELAASYPVKEFGLAFGNDKDFIATRVAYKLNLTGPAMTVQTACSTGLTAVSQACTALRDGQADMVLAGAISITFPTKRPYAYLPQGMASADGHCRTFDADASGTVFSDGAGLVVLRRLDDALAAGDNVIAVIRGVGINNDGGDKAGYAAPSIRGQVGAIKAAHDAAGVTPEQIGYVEAHGTATPLGDPIEFTALQTVFGAQSTERQFCAIGSAKTNIGHLDSAAGIAGLIKTALVLKTGQIPPLLHYKKPNPQIDFESSAFYPATTLTEWQPKDAPRIAGVSSFGVGGTNVHVVLEEAPHRDLQTPEVSDDLRVFPLSGSSVEAVAASVANLGAFAAANPDADPDQVGATLRHGRREFKHRTVLVARNMTELTDAAAAQKRKPAAAGNWSRLAFMFPGQGAQHVGMAQSLFEKAPVFREALSVCTTLLEQELDLNLLDVIHAPDDQREAATEALRNTALAQPAIFAVSYALAKQWDHWGVSPDTMVGHSIGEFVAATLSGVMDLRDALGLIALRGRLMGDLPPGVMVSVRASEEDVMPYLGAGLDLAAVNGAKAVVLAGPEEAADAILPKIEADGHVVSKLHTSHAFHSHMMDPALQPFKEALQRLTLNAPQVPILSTVTGDWLTDDEATSADYWANHMRRPVRFYDAMQTLWADGQHLFLEAGPGRTLSTLAAQNPNRGRVQPALTSLPHAQAEEADSHVAMLEAFGQLWAHGYPVDWARIDGVRRQSDRLPGVPTYPFQRTRHWVEPAAITPSAQVSDGGSDSTEHASTENDRTPLAQVDAGTAVRAMLSDLSGIDPSEMDGDATFLELGFDSLMLTQATREISQRFSVKVSLRDLIDGYSNINALAAYIEETGNVTGLAPAEKTKVGWMAEMERPEPEAKPLKTSAPVTTITRDTEDIRPEQKAHIERLVRRFNEKTPTSKALTQEYRRFHADPRTAAGFNRLWKEATYQIVSDRSKGSRLIDVDGNEYIDMLNGFGPGFLGHTNEVVTKAVAERMERGFEVGPQHLEAMEAAKLFCEVTGNDRASFVCTGSEAVYAAMRLARTVTNRDTIVVFERDYHGNFDEVLVRAVNGPNGPRSLPVAPGVPQDAVKNIVVLPYGTSQSLDWIRQHADSLAAVVIEPVQSRRPEFRPIDFIREVRQITEQSGALMVFDEVVTGFRFGPRGAQAFYGIDADLVTYGKIVGGEMPVGVVAGKARFMDTFDGGHWAYGDDSFPEAPVTFFAGTFVRHPLAMAAVRAMLIYLKAQPELFWHSINAKGDKFAGTMRRWFEDNDMPFEMPNCGSLMYLRVGEEQKFGNLMAVHLRTRGLFLLEGFPCYLTAAHDDEDIEYALEAFKDAALEMRADGMFVGRDAVAYDGPHVTTAPPRLSLPGGAEKISAQMATPLESVRCPTTAAQQEIWTAIKLRPEQNLAYNESVRLDLQGPLDVDALRTAMDMVVERHDALRSTFSEDGTEMVIHRDLPLKMPFTDLSADAGRDDALKGILRREVENELDLINGPLVRTELVRMAPEHHVVVLTAHHIVCDGWSSDVVIRDLGKIYRALIEGSQPQLDPVQSIIDYTAVEAAWRETDEADTVRQFWLDLYQGSVPVIDLPTDRPRTPDHSLAGARLDLEVPEALTQRLRARARQENISFVTLLFGAWSLQMARLVRSETLVIGLPTAGQAARAMPGVVGHCANFLPVPMSVPSEMRLSEYLQNTRKRLLDVFDHQTFTLGEIVRDLKLPREEGRVAMTPLTFNHDMGIDLSDLSFGTTEGTMQTNPRTVEAFELFLNLQEVGNIIVTEWSYNTSLFERDTVAQHAANFIELLEHLSEADGDAEIATLTRSAGETPASGTFEDPDAAGPQDIMVRFRQIAAEHGSRTAVRFGETTLDYATLDARSDALAGALAARGIGPGALVGISSERCIELVISVIGVLKAGAGYVPFDTALPDARLAFMAEDTGIALLLGELAAVEAAGVPVMAHQDFPTEGTAPSVSNAADAPSYVMFTSGTTGTPKAVVQTHQSVTRLIVDADWISLGTDTVTLHSSAFAFDTSIIDIFGALLHGGAVVIPPAGQMSIADLSAAIRDGVNTLWLTSGLFHAVADTQPDAFLDVTQLVVGGDVVSPVHVAQVMTACPNLTVINGFGPTETHICTAHTITSADLERGGSIPIGRAVAGTQAFIVDHDGWPVPTGVPGELAISGRAVANGYWNRPEMTAERFHPAPWDSTLRLYRTGDLAASGRDGVITYFGRIDTQVKIRGFRVELVEVEGAIEAIPGVSQVCVAAIVPEGQIDKVLAAYVVVDDPTVDADAVQAACVTALPEFARPTYVTFVDDLPFNQNGKVDRAALPMPVTVGQVEKVAPATPEEKRLLAIWHTLLQTGDFGVEDNFFSLGGHSLLAVKLFDRIRTEFNQDLPISTLLRHQTPRALATLLTTTEEEPHTDFTKLDKETDWDTTVVIDAGPKGGTARPIFIVGGVGGNVNNLFELGKSVGKFCPVIGLQTRGVMGHRPHDTIEEGATEHIRYMRQHQSKGPYFVAGYSGGAYTALEIVRQLEAMGEEVENFFVLDTNAPHFAEKLLAAYRPNWREWLSEEMVLLRGHGIGMFMVRTWSNLLARVSKATDKIVKRGNRGDVRHRIMRDHWIKAANKYKGGEVTAPITLFTTTPNAASRTEMAAVRLDETYGWREVTKNGQLERYSVNGTHRDMLNREHVSELAEIIQETVTASHQRAAE